MDDRVDIRPGTHLSRREIAVNYLAELELVAAAYQYEGDLENEQEESDDEGYPEWADDNIADVHAGDWESGRLLGKELRARYIAKLIVATYQHEEEPHMDPSRWSSQTDHEQWAAQAQAHINVTAVAPGALRSLVQTEDTGNLHIDGISTDHDPDFGYPLERQIWHNQATNPISTDNELADIPTEVESDITKDNEPDGAWVSDNRHKHGVTSEPESDSQPSQVSRRRAHVHAVESTFRPDDDQLPENSEFLQRGKHSWRITPSPTCCNVTKTPKLTCRMRNFDSEVHVPAGGGLAGHVYAVDYQKIVCQPKRTGVSSVSIRLARANKSASRSAWRQYLSGRTHWISTAIVPDGDGGRKVQKT
ncbi:hypothetical protein BJ170DRAFT_596386 [Xylariales sp. AK1849]|nr:hypothetical protein BJ170DRAFT_596386 [Xylariales sp. AK1849]